MEPSLTGLRVLREVAERGTFTAAAAALGYTQSAVSRQIAAPERTAGTPLVERRPGGIRLTPAGLVLLHHARVVLDEIDAATSELSGTGAQRSVVRLGYYLSAGATLLPRALVTLRRARPDIRVATREGTTPALVRALRAGTLDVALLSSRPPYRSPDGESPRLVTRTVGEGVLLLAVPTAGRFAGRDSVHVDELRDVDWIASPSTPGEPVLGVWLGVAGRPRVVHSARDWLTKLSLVAACCGVTTVPATTTAVLPAGVSLLRVDGAPEERRRTVLARLPRQPAPAVDSLIDAFTTDRPDRLHPAE